MMHITILEKKLKQTGGRYYGTVGVAELKYKILLTCLLEIVNINITSISLVLQQMQGARVGLG